MEFILIGIAILLSAIIVYIRLEPSHDEDWALENAVLPWANIEKTMITVHDIRHFEYRSTTDFTPHYYDQTYNIDKLEKAYLIVEPFGNVGAAHIFISFEFSDKKYLALSVEARKRKGQEFSLIGGVLKRFGLIYIAADEHDIFMLRSKYREHKVYMYPLNADREHIHHVFLSMIGHMNALHSEPEFYNTLTNNCIFGISKHINSFIKGSIPWNYTFLLPSRIDRYALQLGLIDTRLRNIHKIRARHDISTLVEKYADHPNFSEKIRSEINK